MPSTGMPPFIHLRRDYDARLLIRSGLEGDVIDIAQATEVRAISR